MNKAILINDYEFPAGKYRDMGVFRCYGAERFENFCQEYMVGEIDIDNIWKDFLSLSCHNSEEGYLIEAACAKDGKTHRIDFNTTYVFRNEKCMDIGDCECIVIEFGS